MEARLSGIAKELAQVAIDAYFSRPTFSYITYGAEVTSQKVYDELLIGARNKLSFPELANRIAKVAIISHWRNAKMNPEDIAKSILFKRAVNATTAALQKVIRRTNVQRKSLILVD